jgi:hypothetical protein
MNMFTMDLLILVAAVSIFTVAYSLIFERDQVEEPEPVRIPVDRRS